MLFNSAEFAIFFSVFFLLYWSLGAARRKSQNILILAGSYIFYAWWDWRFLSLIILSSFVDYFVGIRLFNSSRESTRKLLLITSITFNLGILFFFKYFNFFIDSLASMMSFLGPSFDVDRLAIILPLGISFYTFQTLSYSIDIYQRKLEPTKDIVAFFAFVSFFPQLVAGPIERATHLLPQFSKSRSFDLEQSSDGMRQILWGLFKKVVIADNCAAYVNEIFGSYSNYSGSTLLLATVFFSFQIYGDFSGYSDIALGTARLLGFDLSRNFAYPYFSRNMTEFWRRWHISLSTWFKDYIYIPLGGSRGRVWMTIRNTFWVFVISGFWHGANWTFVLWGILHFAYLLPSILFGKPPKNADRATESRNRPTLQEAIQIVRTFMITSTAWVFFRSETLSDAVAYLKKMFSSSLFSLPQFTVDSLLTLTLIIIFVIVEWIQREKPHALSFSKDASPRIFRWGIYYLVFLCISYLRDTPQEFIYFQF